MTYQQYQKEKMEFLDSLQPDDFRNAASFNLAGNIIEELNEAYLKHLKTDGSHQAFIEKAVHNLFRKDSAAAVGAINLAKRFVELRT